jgi:hypothetical protein
MRYLPLITRRQIFTSGALASLLFIGLGLTGYVNNGIAGRFNVDPAVLDSFVDIDPRAACDQNHDIQDGTLDFCLFGVADKTRPPEVAVFGDSHAEALLPSFDFAGKALGNTVAHLGFDVVSGNYATGVCEKLANRETKEASRAVFQKALEATIAAYRALGTEVYIIEQVPQQVVNPKHLYYRLARETQESDAQKLQVVSELSVPQSKHERLQQFTRDLFEIDREQNKIKLVSLDSLFCKDQLCLVGDTSSYYKDFNHLNAKGTQLVASIISEVLAE